MCKSFLYKLTLLLVAPLALLISCNTSKKSNRNKQGTARLNFNDENIISYKVYRNSDSTLDLYFYLHLKDLSIKASNGQSPGLRFNYHLYSSEKANQLLDSISFFIVSDPSNRRDVQYRFRHIRCNFKEPLLKMELYDPAGNHHVYNTAWLDLNDVYATPYFQVRKIMDSVVFTRSYVVSGDSIYADYYNHNKQRLYIRYSPLMGLPAPPPFYFSKENVPVANPGRPVGIDNHGFIHFTQPGNYLIQADTNLRQCLWINCFSPGFPYMRTPSEYIYPLMYLTKQTEFNQMNESKDLQGAINQFWVRAAGNETRGPQLADHYYHRVTNANEYFSTSKEGWKTDRGMIYILFGKPDFINKDSWGEIWSYHEHYPYPRADFHFKRDMKPWGEDYTLERSETFRRIYNVAVDAWRNGRVVNE